MSGRVATHVLLVCAALGTPVTACADESQALLDRFRKEAVPGWARLHSAEARLECVVTESEKSVWHDPPKTRESGRRLAWRARPDCFVVEETRMEGGETSRRVLAVNETYYAWLRMDSDRKAWRLSTFGDSKSKAPAAHMDTAMAFRSYLSPVTHFPGAKHPRFGPELL